MVYALLGALVIVIVLAASALSLFLRRRDEPVQDSVPGFSDAEGTTP